MNVQLQGNEQITKLFNDWYRAMLQHQTTHATKIKKILKISSLIQKKIQTYNCIIHFLISDTKF